MTESEPKLPSKKGELRSFPVFEPLQSAYDFGSCGLGTMYHGLQRMIEGAQGEELPGWARVACESGVSNFFQYYSYLERLRKQSDSTQDTPAYPYRERNNTLLHQVFAMTDAPIWQQMRAVLEQALGVPSSHDALPISGAQLEVYLQAAEERSLLHRPYEDDTRTIREIVDSLPPEGDLPSPYNFLFRLSCAHIGFDPQIAEGMDNAIEALDLFTPEHRMATQKAAVYKLGAMLGIVDQLLHEEHAAGRPIPADYLPEDRGVLRINWQEYFGEEVPTIETFLSRAWEIFRVCADPKDPNLSWLFTLDSFQYLQR